MKLKLAIIEDCVEDARKLEAQLDKYRDKVEFSLATFSDEKIENILIEEFDCYFMDIDMPKYNGIELAKEIVKKNSLATFIFYSNREDLVFDSNVVNSIYFVRKAHMERDLDNAMSKIKSLCKSKKTTITFGDKKIQISQIVYISVYVNTLEIHFSKGQIYKVRTSLKSVSKELEKNGFVYVFHGVIVNMRHISKIDDDKFEIILKNNEKLIVSKRKLKKLKDEYLEFIMNDTV